MKKYFIVAGEPSGDIHAAKLMNRIKAFAPGSEFYGIGGECMEKEGLKSLFPLKLLSVAGFWEVAKRYSFFLEVLKRCKEEMKERKVDCYIPVDYPGFNMKLSAFAKSNNIPVFWYIAPQLWAWGKNRGAKLRKIVDKLLVVFPFEKEFFGNLDIPTEYVGHPLLDEPLFNSGFLQFQERNKIIAIFSGSRKQEIIRHLPLVEDLIESLETNIPDFSITLGWSSNLDEDLIFNLKMKYPDVEFATDSRTLMNNSAVGIIKTGTSNLEAALCGLPFVMFYKTSVLSYLVSKRLINLPYVSLVNIIAGKPIVKELIQNDATAEKIVFEVKSILDSPEKYNKMQQEFISIKELLGSSGASERAARIIINGIN